MDKQRTTLVKPSDADRGWVLVNVEDKVVGRAASTIADILRGKHKATYTPNVDNGDFVVAINASKVRFTGGKLEKKEYFHHTGYFGGIKSITAKKQLEKKPEQILRDAVWGMLPKNRLSRQLIKKLKVYPESEHPHGAQNPKELKI
jgi:large subunit ribosomal protein L13